MLNIRYAYSGVYKYSILIYVYKFNVYIYAYINIYI